MAFGLANYASPGGLPRRDARLASSRWSDATGRAFTRRVPTKGFRGVIVTSLPPFPSFAWRKHIALCAFGTGPAGSPAAPGTAPARRQLAVTALTRREMGLFLGAGVQ